MHPKSIQLPFLNAETQADEEELYYQPEDQYSYWYKVSLTANVKLQYKLEPINGTDHYVVLVYAYGKGNFCNDLIRKRVNTIATKNAGSIELSKDSSYYFSVLHVNGKGCGHILSLTANGVSRNIRAIQQDCVEDVIAEMIVEDTLVEIPEVIKVIVEKEVPDTLKKQPVIIPEPIIELKVNPSFYGIVNNKKTKEGIDAVVVLFDEYDVENQLESTKENGFKFDGKLKDRYIVSVNKFGYKPYIDTVVIDTGKVIIELTPLDVGEKLVMRKIYFHPNTYVLKETSKVELNKLKKFMLENSTYHFEIQGHTNGNRMIKRTPQYAHLKEEWNFKGSAKKLSKLRAEKIKAFLVKNGVESINLTTTGYGGDNMVVAKPKNMKQAMRNIRVEVVVVQ